MVNHDTAVIVCDVEGSIRFMNPAAEALTGWREVEALGKEWTAVLEFIPTPTQLPTKRPDRTMLGQDSSLGGTNWTLVAKSGVSAPIDWRRSPIRDDQGNVTSSVFILREIAPPPRMAELLKTILMWGVELLKADAGEIYLYDQDRQVLKLAIGYKYSEDYIGITFGPEEGLAGRVFQSGEPLVLDNYRTWEGRIAVFQDAPPVLPIMMLPLRWHGRTIGTLSIEADGRRRAFGQDDVRLATLFANLAAVAIENARLYTELQDRTVKLKRTLEREVAERTAELAHRALQLETSAQVSRQITSILDIDELLTRVVDLIRETFDYYAVHIYLLERETDRLVLRASSSGAGQRFRAYPEHLEIGVTSLNTEVIRTNEAILVNDVSREPRYLVIDQLPDTQAELVIPLQVGGHVIGTLDVQSAKLGAFGKGDELIIQSLGDQVAIAIENARLYDRSREMAVVEERNRLARELHDSVSQSLFSLDLHAKAIATNLKRDPQQAEDQLNQLRQITYDTLQEMRSLIYELRPFFLEDNGLVPTLRHLLGRLRRPDRPELMLSVSGERRLSAELEQGLFRIAQEALNNAIKHSGARSIMVKLTMDDARITLCVIDDGRGFDPVSPSLDRRAFGLIAMRERAELLGATCEVVSRPGAGTEIRVHVRA
jgi:PAS domain S-box-containing protein